VWIDEEYLLHTNDQILYIQRIPKSGSKRFKAVQEWPGSPAGTHPSPTCTATSHQWTSDARESKQSRKKAWDGLGWSGMVWDGLGWSGLVAASESFLLRFKGSVWSQIRGNASWTQESRSTASRISCHCSATLNKTICIPLSISLASQVWVFQSLTSGSLPRWSTSA